LEEKRLKERKKNLDKIIIRDLSLKTIIGTFPEEKITPQEIILNIELFCDIRRAAKTDNINHTVDYKMLKKEIINFVENNNFNLIEKIAQSCADICLANDKVNAVKITVDKPGCLTKARSAAVQIYREK